MMPLLHRMGGIDVLKWITEDRKKRTVLLNTPCWSKAC